MKPVRNKIEFILQTIVWHIDYIIYLLFSPYKFKKLSKNIKNILIIELIFIGDLIAITPTIRALKKHFPNSNIDIMTLEEMKDVLSGNPNISNIIPYKEEIDKKYDLAIILHPNPKIGTKKISKIIKKIPFRIGCTRVGVREGKGNYLNRKTRPTFKLKHKIEDNLDVIKTIGIKTNDKTLELYTNKEIDNKIKKIFKKLNKKKKNLVIHPIPQHKTHEWLPERFAELSDILSKEFNIIFTGSKKDKEKINEIKKLMKTKHLDLSGNSIREFLSAIKLSDTVISVDTSAMHIAAAFNKPVLALFGAGNPKIWKPYCNKAEIIYNKNKCVSCMKHNCFRKNKRNLECMRFITIEQALNSFNKIKRFI